MTRWTLLAIALAVVGCGGGERDQDQREDSEAAATVDTTETPAPEKRTEPAATDRAEPESAPAKPGAGVPAPGAPADADQGPTGAEAMGGVRGTAAPPRQLSADQVRRLQAALNKDGCDVGPPDGVMGAQTREGIACGLRKHGLRSNDLSGLYRALDLDF